MRKIIVGFFVFSTLCFASVDNVAILRWIDPYGRMPVTHQKWFAAHAEDFKQTGIGNVYYAATDNRQNVVGIVVNASVFAEITAELDTFVQDLTDEGYSVQVDTISGMSHTALRSHLAGINQLAGAIFIGEVPVAWFETDGFGCWEEFPHDLYFCDLDGIYVDQDADGIYDDHTGNVAPEIWLGRIYARNLTWDNEIRLLKQYFNKNHSYRTGVLSVPQRGLSFVDDDWSYWSTCDLDLVYSDVTVVNDDYQTVAINYRDQLGQGYEWINLCAHSSPWGHTFMNGPGMYWGTVFNYEIFTLEPAALFYNLFACSGTRFVEENNSAGWYLFVDPYGLLAVGSTKTGGMLDFGDFYGPIGQQGMCIGDAFKYWFTLHGEEDWDWFYGLNILGDPTLKPCNQTKVASVPRDNDPAVRVSDWEPPEIVAHDFESDAYPKIVSSADGTVWVVWETGRSLTNGRSEIISAYRSTGGWWNAMYVGPFVYWDFCPDIEVDNLDRLVAVWAGWDDIGGNYQYDIFYSIYTGTWSARQSLHSLDPAFDTKPDLVRDKSNTLWVSWESRRDVNLNIYASSFNGSSWSTPQQVTTSNDDEASPDMLVDSLGRPWVLYERRFTDRSEIWASCYTGSQWIPYGPVSGNHTRAYHPAGAVSGDSIIWAVWQSTETGNSDIFASYYAGSNWSDPIQITTNPESDLFGDLATDDSGTVWLVYQSKHDGDWDIYCSCCEDMNWSVPEIIADLPGADINAQITCGSSNDLWVAWQSYYTSDWEIMVSRKPGVGIAEKTNEVVNSEYGISPTLFSRGVKISTLKPHQDIEIFDAKGACVQTLSSDKNGSVIWFPGNLPAGAYFIVVKNNNRQLTRKVLFVK